MALQRRSYKIAKENIAPLAKRTPNLNNMINLFVKLWVYCKSK